MCIRDSKHIVLAVNKIDLVDYSEATYRSIVANFQAFAGNIGFKSITPIPMSARFGDNVSTQSERMPWYKGAHLLSHLEQVDVEDDLTSRPFRMAVQLSLIHI